MRLSIVGKGRLGSSLAILWRRVGHEVELVGRGEVPRHDVVVLCVPDREIANAAGALAPGPTVLHCSGSSSLEPLTGHADHGSLHPLMTFPGPEVALPDLHGVGAAVAGTPGALSLARTLAADLGMVPFEIQGDRRLYHAAAVIAGNFATTLLVEAGGLLGSLGVPRDEALRLLLPLALESLRNAAAHPDRALTGPVVRRDVRIVKGHQQALTDHGDPALAELYAVLVESTHRLAHPGEPPFGEPDGHGSV